MSRTAKVEAVILKTYRIGEHHKGLTLFARGQGIIRAIAHGAYKGRLASRTGFLTWARFETYTDPVKESVKITDVDVIDDYPGLHRSLERFYAASMCAELVVASYGAGEAEQGDETAPAFPLFVETLQVLAGAEPRKVQISAVLFAWRLISALGLRPDLDLCADTGALLEAEDESYYSRVDGQLHSGTSDDPNAFLVSPRARAYLAYTDKRPFGDAVLVAVSAPTLANVSGFLRSMVEEVFGTGIASLRIADPFSRS